jgi:enterochelin esterase-like enzyme
MRMSKSRHVGLWVALGAVGALAVAIYYYVFIAKAQPLDPPPTADVSGNLRFEVKTFDSQAMGTSRRYGVILPPHYRSQGTQRYPVIFMLHGGHDDERAWVEKIGILPVLEQLYKTHKLPPSIVVTPDGNDSRGSSPFFDPNYFDGPNGKVGTLIGVEIPAQIKSHYRTWASPQLWAIGGLSSGGWGGVNIGLHHLEQFNVFFSQIGYFTDKSGPQNSPMQMVQTLTPQQRQQIHVYVDAGKDDVMDTSFLTSSREFHEELDRLKVDNVFYAFPGGHGLAGPNFGWNYDHKHALDSLGFVGKKFQAVLGGDPSSKQAKTPR